MKLKKRAFTMIELLVVIAILMLLVGILFPVISGMRRRARAKTAKARLQTIALKIEEYRLQRGKYPVSTEDSPTTLYDALGEDFMEFSREELLESDDSYLALDSWGNPWVYTEFESRFKVKLGRAEYNALVAELRPHHPRGFDLYSKGEDGLIDPGHNGVDDDDDGKIDEEDELVDDITNWN